MFVHELWKNADPSRLALDGNRALTYAQLSDQVRVVRNVLYKKGIRRKDRVALYSANGVEFVVVYMAVVSLGAIIIPVNSSLVDREVDFILRDSETKLLVTDTPLQVEAPQIRQKKHRHFLLTSQKMMYVLLYTHPVQPAARRALC